MMQMQILEVRPNTKKELLPVAFPGVSVVKNLPGMQETQETWVWSLGQEDPLEQEVAAHSTILTWRIP